MRDPNINLDWTAATLTMERELYLRQRPAGAKIPRQKETKVVGSGLLGKNRREQQGSLRR